jgi:uncharacterized damage-inducible protein DinB
MIPLLQSLAAHLAWADAAMWSAIRDHSPSASDDALRRNLHHIVMVQRAFLSLFRTRPFDLETELRVPDTIDALVPTFRETQADLLDFTASLDEAVLERVIDMPWIPGSRPTVAQALMQVVLHSQNHRSQCGARLRELGGTPPSSDYILWLLKRPAAEWDLTPRSVSH